MGKRSPGFERNPKDFYPTPYEAVVPLLPFLAPKTRFSEPCAGDGALIRHLEKHGHFCYWASDIEDRSAASVVSGCSVTFKPVVADALVLTVPLQQAECVITNPPYSKDVLFPMIDHFTKQNQTWLLLNADFMHNKRSSEVMKRCSKIVSIGRVKWIADSKSGGKENFCWYSFHKYPQETNFIGR